MNDKILKAKNRLWHFYYKNAIYVKSIPSSAASVVTSDAYFDFDVICQGDTFHLIAQDKTGSVIYFKGFPGKWEKEVLLVSKTKTAYNKAFKIIVCGKLIFAFYIIVKDSKAMLVFHCINEKITPIVIDYITPSPRSFFVYTDPDSNLFIYYTNSDGALGKRIYRWSKKAFEPFEAIKENASCPFAADDNTLSYISAGKLFFGGEEVFSSAGGELSAPIIYKDYVMWHMSGTVFYLGPERAVKKLPLPSPAASVFEIKDSENPIYLYAATGAGSISLAVPDPPLSLADIFKEDKKGGEDKLDLILKRLDAIERLIKGGK